MSAKNLQRDIELLSSGELPPLSQFESKTTVSRDGLIISTF